MLLSSKGDVLAIYVNVVFLLSLCWYRFLEMKVFVKVEGLGGVRRMLECMYVCICVLMLTL